MREKLMKQGCLRRWISGLLIMAMVILLIPAVPGEASARSTAISQYRKLLSKSRISVLPQGKMVFDYNSRYVRYWSSSRSRVRFFLGYIDGDDVPELVLSDSQYGYGIWSYKNGAFRCLYWNDSFERPIGYYRKKGIFRENGYSEGTIFYMEYYKLQTGKFKQDLQFAECNDGPDKEEVLGYYLWIDSNENEVSRSTFYKKLRKYTGGKSMSRIHLYSNTAANRKKYLK